MKIKQQDDYIIANVNLDDMHYLIDWAAEEGWNPGLHDATCFYHTDSNGFFVGRLHGDVIACGSAVCYDDQFAFCGFYIVKPGYRGKNYGLQLTKARLAYAGSRNVALDGVVDMVDKYKRLGYRSSHLSTQYRFIAKQSNIQNSNLVSIDKVDFDDLVIYDTKLFPAERRRFLRNWIQQPDSIADAYIDQEHIMGYALARKCRVGYKIGPLFADSDEVAHSLLRALCNELVGSEIFISIPEPNPAGDALVKKYAMRKIFSCVRMYLRRDPKLDLNKIYGLTSFELG